MASTDSIEHVLAMLDYTVISSVLTSIGRILVYLERSTNTKIETPQSVNTADKALKPYAANT